MSTKSNSPNPVTASSRILVTNVAISTTEQTLKDFFAFCGEIQAMHIYSNETGTQEAVIKFDGEAAASTACLLNNALVDGAHINIKSLPSVEGATSSQPSASPKPPKSPQAMVSGLFSSIVSAGKSLADTVTESAKKFDEQYQVSDKVSSAATTAWTTTRDTALSVDEKLKISETTNKLYSDVKTKVVGSTGKASPSPSMSNAEPPRSASPLPKSPSPQPDQQ